MTSPSLLLRMISPTPTWPELRWKAMKSHEKPRNLRVPQGALLVDTHGVGTNTAWCSQTNRPDLSIFFRRPWRMPTLDAQHLDPTSPVTDSSVHRCPLATWIKVISKDKHGHNWINNYKFEMHGAFLSSWSSRPIVETDPPKSVLQALLKKMKGCSSTNQIITTRIHHPHGSWTTWTNKITSKCQQHQLSQSGVDGLMDACSNGGSLPK